MGRIDGAPSGRGGGKDGAPRGARYLGGHGKRDGISRSVGASLLGALSL